jgi:hypothetical protein
MSAGVALDVIEMRALQLFHHAKKMSNFSCCLRKAERETLAFFLLHLEQLPLPFVTGKNNSSTNKNHGKSEKKIVIGQRVLESGK